MLISLLAAVVRLITGVKVSHYPFEENVQHIFFSNHSSHLDFIVIWSALPKELRDSVVPVAAKDYWSKGCVKPWVAKTIFNAVLLNRKGRPANRTHPMQPVFDALNSGKSIIIFPEGTRSSNGQMKPFKAGIFGIAERYPKHKFVPVALDNLTRILPKGEFLPLPIIGRAAFLEPTQLKSGESKTDFLLRMHGLIKNELKTDEC